MVDVIAVLKKPQKYTTVVFKGDVVVSGKVTLNGVNRRIEAVSYGNAIEKLDKLGNQIPRKNRRLNHVARKVLEIFQSSSMKPCKLAEYERLLGKHESKMETLAWCVNLSDKSIEKLALSLGADPVELRIALRVFNQCS